MDYFDWSNFGTGFNPQQQGNITGWGGGEMQNGAEQQVLQGTQLFQQTFQNLVGRAPTPQELGQFQTQALTSAVNAPGDLSYTDSASLSNNFINQSFGPQIAQHQQDLQTQQLGQTQQTITDLVNKQVQAQAADLTNPKSPTYQSFAGSMNNMGITPDSGAFAAGMGGTLGQAAAGDLSQALGQVSLPAVSGIQGMNQNPFQFSLGNSDTSHLNQLGDFGLQAGLASQLSGGSSNLLGEIAAMMQGTGSLAQGGAAVGKATWICTAMREAEVMTDGEIRNLHDHLFKAKWKKPFKFLGYFLFGKCLVFLSESAGTHWGSWKPLFYDEVIREPDPVKAVALYERAFWDLFAVVRARLANRRQEANS